jgi:hypothetical protein
VAQRNVKKELAWIFVATIVLAAGMFWYLKSTIPTAEDLKADMHLLAPSASAGAASSLTDRATEVSQRFITALREQRFRDAYALTTRDYRKAVSAAEFEAAINVQPYLATAREISFVRISQQTMKRENGETVVGPVLCRGMLVAGHGNVDTSVTLVHEDDTLRVLTIIAAGVPIFKGMVAAQ